MIAPACRALKNTLYWHEFQFIWNFLLFVMNFQSSKTSDSHNSGYGCPIRAFQNFSEKGERGGHSKTSDSHNFGYGCPIRAFQNFSETGERGGQICTGDHPPRIRRVRIPKKHRLVPRKCILSFSEAFSHNPAHGSFAPLAFQPSAMTNCVNQRFLSY